MRKIEKCYLDHRGERIFYEVERRAVKRLNMRVRRDGSVHVSAPRQVPIATVQRFVEERAGWIVDARHRVLARRPTTFVPIDGAMLPIAGKSYYLTVVKGKQGVTTDGDRLLLSLRDPTDMEEGLRVIRRFVKAQAATVLTAAVERIYPTFAPNPPTLPQLSIRWMRTRWGSCTAAKNHITLNEKLVFLEPGLIDYVIYHEFCHFKHQDHSPAFYQHLSRYFPQYAAARRALSLTAVPALYADR